MARSTIWQIDMGDGTWSARCTGCRLPLGRGPRGRRRPRGPCPSLRAGGPTHPRPPAAPVGLTRVRWAAPSQTASDGCVAHPNPFPTDPVGITRERRMHAWPHSPTRRPGGGAAAARLRDRQGGRARGPVAPLAASLVPNPTPTPPSPPPQGW
jgi:hypothetical protein